MTINPLTFTIRAKKLGALMRDARQSASASAVDCAAAIGVAPEVYLAYELGEQSPSLPELELLAFFLEIPLEHFWGTRTLGNGQKPGKQLDPGRFVGVRQRMVGAQIRQGRIQSGLSMESLAEQISIPVEILQAYEFGERSVPLPQLEALSQILSRTIKDFQDRHGPVGTWVTQQKNIKDFLELSPELQSFVSKPINRPYLELAQRLSEMSVDKLRAVAEGLLEITL